MNTPAPLFKEILIALVVATVVILVSGCVIVLRLLRRKLAADAQQRLAADGPEFQLHAYHSVIQRLREQEAELKRVRQAETDRAAASENISQAVLSNLSSGVVLFSPSGMVRQANDAAKALLGYASMFGLHARDIFRGAATVRHEIDTANAPVSLGEAVERTVALGEVFRRMEAEYFTPAGERRVLGVTSSPVRTAAGQSLGAACLLTDLTEITELARQVRLRENLATIGEMSAGIAHEFKNSLASISGYAHILAGEDDPASMREFAEKIRTETFNLSRMVGDFLQLGKPLELNREPVDVQALLEDCARECDVTLDCSNLPPDCMLEGDPLALRQAFSNLLRNSADAVPPDVSPHISVKFNLDGSDNMQLVLRDNGSGIPAEILPKIFIPFFTTKSAGTGLGLALVHRIVTEHGGTIAVASNGSGTTFTLSFPARKLASQAAAPR